MIYIFYIKIILYLTIIEEKKRKKGYEMPNNFVICAGLQITDFIVTKGKIDTVFEKAPISQDNIKKGNFVLVDV